MPSSHSSNFDADFSGSESSDDPDQSRAVPNSLSQLNDATDADSEVAGTPEEKINEQGRPVGWL